VTSSNQLHL